MSLNLAKVAMFFLCATLSPMLFPEDQAGEKTDIGV